MEYRGIWGVRRYIGRGVYKGRWRQRRRDIDKIERQMERETGI